MASVAEIQPLSTEFQVPSTGDKSAVEKEITALGKVIFEKATVGLKSATQAVVSNVPEMIKDLTTQIESGSIENFNVAINKLNNLINKLGLNLRDYNSELADTVDRFRGTQEELNDEIARLREQGIAAEINDRGDAIKLITQKEIKEKEKQIESNNEQIKLSTDAIQEYREQIEKLTPEQQELRENLEDRVTAESENVKRTEESTDSLKKQTNVTADTGANMGGFSKLAELKEAFMVIPDTINEVAGGFAQFGKSLMVGFKKFIGDPLGTIGRMFKTIGNIFKSARALLALKILGVLAAFQFFAEKIDAIGDFFVGIWEKITGYFQGIVDWFKNSAIGKFFFGDKEEKDREDRLEGKGKYQTLEGEGAIDISQDAELSGRDSKAPIQPFYSKSLNTIIQPDSPAYMDIKKRDFNTSEQMVGSDGKIVPMVNEPKSLLAERQVVGNNMADGSDTSDALKMLQGEASVLDKPVVTNIQNNSNVTSQNSSGTTVSGFIDHEPDTSFKYVRRDNGDQYI